MCCAWISHVPQSLNSALAYWELLSERATSGMLLYVLIQCKCDTTDGVSQLCYLREIVNPSETPLALKRSQTVKAGISTGSIKNFELSSSSFICQKPWLVPTSWKYLSTSIWHTRNNFLYCEWWLMLPFHFLVQVFWVHALAFFWPLRWHVNALSLSGGMFWSEKATNHSFKVAAFLFSVFQSIFFFLCFSLCRLRLHHSQVFLVLLSHCAKKHVIFFPTLLWCMYVFPQMWDLHIVEKRLFLLHVLHVLHV